MSKSYTKEQQNQIVREYMSGKTVAQLAVEQSTDSSKYDSIKPEIRKVLVDNGVRLRRGKRPAHLRMIDSTTAMTIAAGIVNQLDKSYEVSHALIVNLRKTLKEISPITTENAPFRLEGNA